MFGRTGDLYNVDPDLLYQRNGTLFNTGPSGPADTPMVALLKTGPGLWDARGFLGEWPLPNLGTAGEFGDLYPEAAGTPDVNVDGSIALIAGKQLTATGDTGNHFQARDPGTAWVKLVAFAFTTAGGQRFARWMFKSAPGGNGTPGWAIYSHENGTNVVNASAEGWPVSNDHTNTSPLVGVLQVVGVAYYPGTVEDPTPTKRVFVNRVFDTPQDDVYPRNTPSPTTAAKLQFASLDQYEGQRFDLHLAAFGLFELTQERLDLICDELGVL